jgi:hypothetical protein
MTAEQVKLIVYVDAWPLGTGGGGGLSAVIAIVADAALAAGVATPPPSARQATAAMKIPRTVRTPMRRAPQRKQQRHADSRGGLPVQTVTTFLSADRPRAHAVVGN